MPQTGASSGGAAAGDVCGNAAAGGAWYEEHLLAAVPSYAFECEDVTLGHSILVKPNLATESECAVLVAAATAAAESLDLEGDDVPTSEMAESETRVQAVMHELARTGALGAELQGRERTYTERVPGRLRLQVTRRLSEEAQALSDALVRRALTFIALHVPDMGEAMLQTPASRFATLDLHYSYGEPAVNIYTEGGRFEPHEEYAATD